MVIRIEPAGALGGTAGLPGDKSISHRALMLAAIAHGPSTLTNLAPGADVAATRRALQQLGVRIEAGMGPNAAVVHGRGPESLHAPTAPLDCGNSGTTMRLMLGLLAGLGLPATLTGDASLCGRPMARIAAPLQQMGAQIQLASGGTAPIVLAAAAPGAGLLGTHHVLAIPSGQLKGALLLAGLHARGHTELSGALGGRDHTETLLRAFGASIHVAPAPPALPALDDGRDAPGRVPLRAGPADAAAAEPGAWAPAHAGRIGIEGSQRLMGCSLAVPGDISAAAFYLAASQRVPGARLAVADVGLNPSRLGFVRALQAMGAALTVRPAPERIVGEPRGDIEAAWAPLHGITLTGAAIAPLIDELPVLAVLACCAHGETVVRGAAELRVKETDRIEAIADNLRRMGAAVHTFADGFGIVGPQPLRGAALDAMGDHRIAMAMAIAALGAEGPSTIAGAECAAVSDPHFFTKLAALTGATGEHA